MSGRGLNFLGGKGNEGVFPNFPNTLSVGERPSDLNKG